MPKKWTRRIRPSDASDQLFRTFEKLTPESQDALLQITLALERADERIRRKRQLEADKGGKR